MKTTDPFDYICDGQMTFEDIERDSMDTIRIGLALQAIALMVDQATFERIGTQLRIIEEEVLKYIEEQEKNDDDGK